MASLVFPDNTVLCHFAAISRVDLLIEWLRGRGRWCEAVHAETLQSQAFLPALAALTCSQSPLGEPIEIDDPARIELIDAIRVNVFGGSVAEPLKHLGEAQTCFLLREDSEFVGSWWVSDDGDAYEYAKRREIRTYCTREILDMIVSDGDLTTQQAEAIAQTMEDAGRVLLDPKDFHK